jgi:integrase
VYGGTKAEALAKRERALAERGDAGSTFDPDGMTVGAYLDSWLNDSVRGHVRPSTFYRHESIVRLHIKPALGRLKLAALNPAHVQALYRAKLDQELSPTYCPSDSRCFPRSFEASCQMGSGPLERLRSRVRSVA